MQDSGLSKVDEVRRKLETPGQTIYSDAEFDNFDVTTDFKDTSLDDALFKNTFAVTETKDKKMKAQEAMRKKKSMNFRVTG